MMETCATYSCRCFRNPRFTLEHILYQVGPGSWWKYFWSVNMNKNCTQFPGSDRFLVRYICNTQISTSLRVTLLWNLTGMSVVLLLKRQSCPGRFVISLPSVPTWRPCDDVDLGQIGSGDALLTDGIKPLSKPMLTITKVQCLNMSSLAVNHQLC